MDKIRDKKLKRPGLTGNSEDEELVVVHPFALRTPRGEEKKSVPDEQKTLTPALRTTSELRGVEFLTDVLRGNAKGFPGGYYKTRLATGVSCLVNSVAGKYKQGIANGATSIAWNSIGSAVEFAALDQVFDEFFVHSVSLRYVPLNRYSAQSTATTTASGSPGDVNSCAATVYCLLHGAADYSDSSAGWYTAAVSRHHKFVDMGQPWRFVVRNPEKFAKKGPLGDMSTASSTMSWCQTTASSKYGGFFGLFTPYASGASASIGALLEGGTFGHILCEWEISFRARA